MAKAIAKKSGRSYVLDTIFINLRRGWQDLGRDMLVVNWVIFMVLGFIGLMNPYAAIALSIVSISGMYLMGILPIGFGSIMGLIFISIIIFIGIKKARTT